MIKRIIRVNDSKENERCEKHQKELANEIVDKEETPEILSQHEEQIIIVDQEEFPFQDILADQRRKYNSTQQYEELIYNDLAKHFVKKWEGHFLRKTVISKGSLESIHSEVEEVDTEVSVNREKFAPYFKFCKPDEMVEIVFVNDNSYVGRLSKRKMEGQGHYRWNNGSQYKGEFENNKIQGKGLFELQDCVQYDGHFEDGFYHGKGTMVDKDYNLLYIGQWRRGQKHGKGFCRFETKDSYDGDWVIDKREGIGNRVYASGARYIGDWKNGLRHGKGIMTWPNGDSYRGEWSNGQMHGYGEYTWNGFISKGFCLPQKNCYEGQWHQGKRHGKGKLTLNSIGGAKYAGEWKENKKHGHGTIIGNNGDVTERDPLFENDILLPVATKNLSEDVKRNGSHELEKKPEVHITSVLKPEQCPSLKFFTNRLRPVKVNFPSCSSINSVKCRKCENISCSCIGRPNNQLNDDRSSKSSIKLAEETEIRRSTSIALGVDERKIAKENNLETNYLEEEERLVYNCIALHMPRIRKIYDLYAKIFCNKPMNCKLTLCRLSLWQLWRDCEVHKKNLSLIQIDRYLAKNKLILIEDPHCPYGRIEIWQFIHALLEVSWYFYTKSGDFDEEGHPGKLANGLHRFLVNDIFPNAGNFTGILSEPECDLPPFIVYQLYKSIGEPHTSRQLLRAIFQKRGNTEGDLANLLLKNSNSVSVNVDYMSSVKPTVCRKSHKTSENDALSAYSLVKLRELGAPELIRIMSVTCPSIKNAETDIIVNMEYEDVQPIISHSQDSSVHNSYTFGYDKNLKKNQLTFLEFLEILIESGKEVVRKKKVDKMRTESVNTSSIVKSDRMSSSASHLSLGSKSTRSRKKHLKKH